MSINHNIIKLRRGTAAEWASSEPQPGGEILKLGEPGYEKDTRKLKIGNGIDGWNNLDYISGGAEVSIEDMQDIIGASGFLIGGTGINISYNDSLDSLTINTTGVSLSGHNHISTNITDFNSSVSGLIPVKDIIAGPNVSLINNSGSYTISSSTIATESSSLITTVFNKTGSPIPKFSVVYINGGQGDQPTIGLAVASGEMTSSKTYGITAESISNMSTGKVIVNGALSGLNTDQFNPTAPTGNVNGSILYLSPSTPGGATTTKPSAPNHIVAVGTIVRTHQNEGIVEVRIQNGFELEELHNVAISGVTGGQFLQYNSGSGLWVPTSSGNFNTLQVNGTGVSVSGHTHPSTDITDSTLFGRNLLTAASYPAQNKLGWTVVPTNTGVLTAEAGGKYYFPRISFVGPPSITTFTVNDPASGTFGDFYDIIKSSGNYNPNVSVGGINYGQSFDIIIQRYWSSDPPNGLTGSWKTRILNVNDNRMSTVADSGTLSGSNAINIDYNNSIQTLTLDGSAVTFTKGSGWPSISTISMDVVLRISVTSATAITWTIVTDWFNQAPSGALSIGTHLFLLRGIGTSIVEGHYIGSRTN